MSKSKYYGINFCSQEKESSLTHYGILGQKWRVRRFQNLDRSYTPEGKERYRKSKDGLQTTSKKYKDNEVEVDYQSDSNPFSKNEGMKIYVPYSEDHSILNAYKAATNWSAYADYMVESEPVVEEPEEPVEEVTT